MVAQHKHTHAIGEPTIYASQIYVPYILYIYLRLPIRCDKCVYLSLPNAIFTMQRHQSWGISCGTHGVCGMWNMEDMEDMAACLLTRRHSVTPPLRPIVYMVYMVAIKANSQGKLISSGS